MLLSGPAASSADLFPVADSPTGRGIYLDYAATTPVDPSVARTMAGFLAADGNFGNPASATHEFGRLAADAVEDARGEVAKLLAARPREIVWTSGATEAINLAMKGAALARRDRGAHIVTSALEHKAVLDTAAWLESQGFDVDRLRPVGDGTVTAESLAEVLRPDTVLVSLMHVNNETGTVADIAELGSLIRRHGALFHVDAVQSAARLPLDEIAAAADFDQRAQDVRAERSRCALRSRAPRRRTDAADAWKRTRTRTAPGDAPGAPPAWDTQPGLRSSGGTAT